MAELVTANGFKSAYAIKDGAEGPRGWMVCSLIFEITLNCDTSITAYLTDEVIFCVAEQQTPLDSTKKNIQR